MVGGVTGGVIGGVKTGESGAVRAIGNIRPPQLIKKVNPIYPEEAKKKGLEGVVILEAETDPFGNIVRTQILRSVPEFDQAAIEAVRQWKYAPAIINGKPRGLFSLSPSVSGLKIEAGKESSKDFYPLPKILEAKIFVFSMLVIIMVHYGQDHGGRVE